MKITHTNKQTLAQTNKDKAVPLKTMVSKMHADQGIGGFYRGVEANVLRACVLNAIKMGVYDLTKGYVAQQSGWDRKDTEQYTRRYNGHLAKSLFSRSYILSIIQHERI